MVRFLQELEAHRDALDALAKLRSATNASAGPMAEALQAVVAAPAFADRQTVQKPKAPEVQALQRFVAAVGADRTAASRSLPGLLEQAARRLQVEVPGLEKPAPTYTEQQVQERVNAAVRAAGAGAEGTGAQSLPHSHDARGTTCSSVLCHRRLDGGHLRMRH